jgi:hypothetical protein
MLTGLIVKFVGTSAAATGNEGEVAVRQYIAIRAARAAAVRARMARS